MNPFRCARCEERFANPAELARHEQTHAAPPSAARTPYHAPVLRELGDVAKVTNATFSADGNARRKPHG
jgi:hypothetical protein